MAKNPSQKDLVLSYLLMGKGITPMKALAEFNIFRLADVIYKLKKEGWPIGAEIKTSMTGKRYAEYKLMLSPFSTAGLNNRIAY